MKSSLWKSGKAPQKAAGLSHFYTGTADLSLFMIFCE
jgi:hypothetical protein